MTVTPVAGINSVVVSSATPVVAVPANPNGGFISNPYYAADQGLVTAETLYIDPVGSAGVVGNGTTFPLLPGQTWTIIAGQTTPTTVNAPTGGHRFSVVYW